MSVATSGNPLSMPAATSPPGSAKTKTSISQATDPTSALSEKISAVMGPYFSDGALFKPQYLPKFSYPLAMEVRKLQGQREVSTKLVGGDIYSVPGYPPHSVVLPFQATLELQPEGSVRVTIERPKEIGRGAFKTVSLLPGFKVSADDSRVTLDATAQLVVDPYDSELPRVRRGIEWQRVFRSKLGLESAIYPAPKEVSLGVFRQPWANGDLKTATTMGIPETSHPDARWHMLTFPERLQACVSVAKALAGLHRLKCVHRDVKRQNTLVRYDPETKTVEFSLTDFDIVDRSGHNERQKNAKYWPWDWLSNHGGREPSGDLYGLAVMILDLVAPGWLDYVHVKRKIKKTATVEETAPYVVKFRIPRDQNRFLLNIVEASAKGFLAKKECYKDRRHFFYYDGTPEGLIAGMKSLIVETPESDRQDLRRHILILEAMVSMGCLAIDIIMATDTIRKELTGRQMVQRFLFSKDERDYKTARRILGPFMPSAQKILEQLVAIQKNYLDDMDNCDKAQNSSCQG